ncbi:MAG: hypothetical protein V3V96_15390 [Acidiferrobacterales bacterium]
MGIEVKVSTPVNLSLSNAVRTQDDVALIAATVTLIRERDQLRRELIITNLMSNASEVRIGDHQVSTTRGIPLQPGETIVLDTVGVVYGFSTPGESVAVGETF